MAGVVLLSAVGLTACSSPSSTAPPGSAAALSRIRQAVARTEAAGTAHLVEASDSRWTPGGTSTQPVSEDHLGEVGDIRFVGPDLALTTTSRSTLPSSASSSTSPDAPSTTTTSSSSQSIYLGRRHYVRVPPEPAWHEVPVHAPFAYLGAVTTRFLETAQGPVTEEGHHEIDGRATTEFLVAVPRSVQRLPLTDSYNHPYTARLITAPFTLAVWLDAAGRIVRTEGAEVVTSSRSTGRARELLTATLSAFGEPVHIVAPAVVVHPG
jgi:hypothetical protein